MNDLGELKRHVQVHARGQRIGDYRTVLDRIATDDGGGPGSWAGEWSKAGERLVRQGLDLEAAKYFAMARFPFVDGPARQEAQDRGVAAIDRWRQRSRSGIEPFEADLPGGRVRCWAAGLSSRDPKPLLVLMGGIVTVKEQWAPTLAKLGRLGMAGIVAELPGVGANPLTYTPDSWRMLSGLLDALAGQADVTRTYAIAMSFSGHMAMRCAVEDPRVKGIVTTNAPVKEFFTDGDWLRGVPRVTLDTLAHLSGSERLADWALTEDQLAALDIPLAYMSCLRDEIIPAADLQLLRKHVRDLKVREYDDVHGAPNHTEETQLWSIASLLEATGAAGPQRALISMLLRGKELRRKLRK
ncbi:alpha/beta fold hydrolase [Actinocrispum wychmicini]|uniref:Dienelactone hydrolase n=1 Tax=Actinocrispum wychmicini TaxID=1213861 RepID=A0A4R2JL87_9PSEU|nr:alpha/beta hydrolase [Actinocrispum wychmicini]TCO60791.1 dienelactone hydrolase [Actinocrispum wychmicini]